MIRLHLRLLRLLLRLLSRSDISSTRRGHIFWRYSPRRLSLPFQPIHSRTEGRLKLWLLGLLRELLLLEVLQLGVVDAGVIPGVGREVELREVLGGIYCGWWFIILRPVGHGHSPPICRYGETFIDVRKRLRDLIVNRTTRVSRLDGMRDPKSRLIMAHRNTERAWGCG